MSKQINCLKLGYAETEYHTLKTESGEFLCYDVMTKSAVN